MKRNAVCDKIELELRVEKKLSEGFEIERRHANVGREVGQASL